METTIKYKAVYTPPPDTEGTVTLVMPESTAANLKALLGHCSGRVFDELYYNLGALPLKKVDIIDLDPILLHKAQFYKVPHQARSCKI